MRRRSKAQLLDRERYRRFFDAAADELRDGA
jgi:hypothetical protein